ncbi:hypothetical protein HZH68_005007 [Vespula germanica]|uniref:Uncharacterized protein n=1 Tax=Vespula germanica TaxID=30212 RepID=A0A834KF97_VESGE|nr:hypothetical protein HZH68_005007 [Vespula germanica]
MLKRQEASLESSSNSSSSRSSSSSNSSSSNSNNSASRMSYLTRGKEDRFFLHSSNTECNKDISSVAKFQSGPSTSSWVRDVGSIAGTDAKGGAGLETEERNGTINFVFSSLSNGGVSPHSS